MKREDDNWEIMVGVPFSFAKPSAEWFNRNCEGVNYFISILYLDDGIEISYIPTNRADEILHKEPLRKLQKKLYGYPLGQCPDCGEDVEEYGCTIWCAGGVLSGAYALPV